jgi:hypothetical protein
MIFCKIVSWLFINSWIAANVYEACCKSGREMYDELVANQCLIGRFAANVFYAPAWILKGVKALIK